MCDVFCVWKAFSFRWAAQYTVNATVLVSSTDETKRFNIDAGVFCYHKPYCILSTHSIRARRTWTMVYCLKRMRTNCLLLCIQAIWYAVDCCTRCVLSFLAFFSSLGLNFPTELLRLALCYLLCSILPWKTLKNFRTHTFSPLNSFHHFIPDVHFALTSERPCCFRLVVDLRCTAKRCILYTVSTITMRSICIKFVWRNGMKKWTTKRKQWRIFFTRFA